MKNCQPLSYVQLFATPWTVDHQTPLSIGFPRQEYWNGLLFPSPGDLPHPGIKPQSPTLQPPGKMLKHAGVSGIQIICKCKQLQNQLLSAQSCLTLLRFHGLYPARLLCPWYFPGKNTGVGCHFLLQVLPSPSLLSCRTIGQ